MRRETQLVVEYLGFPRLFTDVLKTLPKTKKIKYIKKMLDLNKDTELTHVQSNLFYAAMKNIEWDIVLKELV